MAGNPSMFQLERFSGYTIIFQSGRGPQLTWLRLKLGAWREIASIPMRKASLIKQPPPPSRSPSAGSDAQLCGELMSRNDGLSPPLPIHYIHSPKFTNPTVYHFAWTSFDFATLLYIWFSDQPPRNCTPLLINSTKAKRGKSNDKAPSKFQSSWDKKVPHVTFLTFFFSAYLLEPHFSLGWDKRLK